MSTPIPVFDPEDPKLTAYALGELTDPADRAEVERLLQHSPEAQLAMKEIQDITNTLTAEYDQERHAADAPVGTADDLPPNVVPMTRWMPESRWRWLPPLATVAAMLLLFGSLAFVFYRTKRLDVPPVASEVVDLPTDPVQALILPEQDPATATAMADSSASSAAASAPPAEEMPPADQEPEITLGAPGTPQLPTVALAAPNIAVHGQPHFVQPQLIPPDAKRGPVPQNGVVGGVPAPTGTGGQANGLAGQSSAAKPQIARVFRDDTQFFRQQSGLSDTDEQGRARYATTVNSPAPEGTLYNAKRITAHPGVATMAKKAEGESPRDKVLRREVPAAPEFNTAAYDHVVENPFLGAKENPLSTFSIDVDTASYANVRRFINSGSLPPAGAVRIEEMLNYFPYDYAPPATDSDKPFAVHLDAASCPWAPEHRLVRIGIKGKEVAQDKRGASNLVFLLDVSGSMTPPERLPLIKKAMSMMVEHLTDSDRVAIVTYAGNSGLVLPSTDGAHKDAILGSLDRLEAGGSTNGASGIELAYRTAKENFIKGGTNRVILATDGDFNVGVTDQGALIRLIQEQAKSGVFLSVLGVGTDNFKDSTMQKLADKGNGNYNYLDRLEEARKVLVEQMGGTLVTIAKDVKIQVEFNPAVVGSYRLVGYEKRMLRKEDFNNDKIDAGEIGAGHSVTALYEVVPFGQPTPESAPAVDALKYGDQPPKAARATEAEAPMDKAVDAGRAMAQPEMLTVKMRHKAPDADKSERTYEVPMYDNTSPGDFAKASPDFKFAAAVATFGLCLRDSSYKGSATLGAAVEMAQEGKGADPKGYRQEFIELARRAQALKDAQ